MHPSHIRGFASDNNSGVHPDIMQAISEANTGHAIAYGNDRYTQAAVAQMQALFGGHIRVFFVYNGTGANVLGLTSATRSYHSVICAETAHVNVDECGAPEKFSGCKLLPVPTADGKISCDGIEKYLHGFGFEHHAQPKVISITQPTELGTVYTIREIRELSDLAHEYQLILHMDGARLSNAAVALNKNFKEITADVGVDVLSFGGTKNGMMFGEAVVFFNSGLANGFRYIRKQGMHLHSKMRFISAQFNALLSNDLWKRNASHANRMAKILAFEIEAIPQITVTQPVETNAVFAVIPPRSIQALQEQFFFYVWNEAISEVRWMTSFDTEKEDVLAFAALLRNSLSHRSKI